MYFEYFFARRITLQHQRSVTALVVRLAVISIALAVATMEVSLSVVEGFESEIQKKVIGFGSHIQVGNYYRSIDTREVPLPKSEPSIARLDSLPNISHIYPYLASPAMCRSERAILGVQLKGVDNQYDWTFFQQALREGRLPNLAVERESLEVLISRKQAKSLDVGVGDRLRLYFQRDSIIKQRRVNISGIYESGLEEFDAFLILCDLRMLQRIRSWKPDQVEGFEVKLENIEEDCHLVWDFSEWPFIHWDCKSPLDTYAVLINESTPYNFEAQSIMYLYPEIFDWLSLQHQNVWFILSLMIIVALINMSSVMLILILERSHTIGILKAMGLASFRARRIFVINVFFLIAVGVLIGNLLGLGLLWSQEQFGWVRVSQENYFINIVPVSWVWWRFLGVNLGVIATCTVFMFIPSVIITRITPLQAIRFE